MNLVQNQVNKSINQQINRLILATHNAHKAEEVRHILQDLGIEVVSLEDIGWIEDIIENGDTFSDNAAIKVNAVAERYPDEYILADDSGLEVDVLDGAPGVRSARYAGDDRSSEALCSKLISEIKLFPFSKRTARFVTTLAFYQPFDKTIMTFEGVVDGLINDTMVGTNGFGYDPVFYLPDKKKTMAEMDANEKNQLSHRYKALKKFKEYING